MPAQERNMVREKGGKALWRPDTRLIVPPPLESKRDEQLSPTQRLALMDLADFLVQTTHTRSVVLNGNDADRKRAGLIGEEKANPFVDALVGKGRRRIPAMTRLGDVEVEAGVVGLVRHGIPTVKFRLPDGETQREFEVTVDASRVGNLKPMTAEDYDEVVTRLTLPQSRQTEQAARVAEVLLKIPHNDKTGSFHGVVERVGTTSSYIVTDALSPDLNLSGRPTGIKALLEVEEDGTDLKALVDRERLAPHERPGVPMRQMTFAFLDNGLVAAVERNGMLDEKPNPTLVENYSKADAERHAAEMVGVLQSARINLATGRTIEQPFVIGIKGRGIEMNRVSLKSSGIYRPR